MHSLCNPRYITSLSPFDLSRGRKLIASMGSLVLVFLLLGSTIAPASEFDDAFISDRYDRKVLFLTSDIVRALELAKLEAQKVNVKLEQLTRYAIFFEKDILIVSLAPPYKGGLDGPEFRVEIRRSDLSVLSVENKLEVKEGLPTIDLPIHIGPSQE